MAKIKTLKTKNTIDQDKEIFRKMKFGFRESPKDERDYNETKANALFVEELPEEFLAKSTPVLDQLSVGSCVAHATATMLAQGDMTNWGKTNNYSRGFIYGNRSDDDYQGEGMYTREALKHLNHDGDCLYEDFPYNEKYPLVKARISKDKENLIAKANPHKIISYYRCYGAEEIKRAIYNYGGCVIGIDVFGDFGRDLHRTKSTTYKGGHAMCIVGWTKDNRWIVQNSWGKLWGYNGLLYMDFDYPIREAWGVICNGSSEPQPKVSVWTRICKLIIKIIDKLLKK